MLKIELAISDGQGGIGAAGNGRVNEDCVGHHGHAAWVIDGATGVGRDLTEAPSDAAWLAQTANLLLAETLARTPDMPSVDLLRSVMADCAEALDRARVREPEGAHELPSAAFAMVRVIGGEVEFTTLADCRIAAIDADGEARLFGQSDLDGIADRMQETIRAFLSDRPGASYKDLSDHLMPGLRATRRRMNRAGGYWVLGTDPAAADHVWQARIPLRPGARFAVASDGFLRLAELFDVATAADFLAISGEGDWARWLERLRALEADAASLHRFPRVKPHDDASLVVCRWDAA